MVPSDRRANDLLSTIRNRYAARLGLSLLIVVIVISSVGLFIAVESGSALRDDTGQNLERASRLQAESLGQWISKMEEETRLLSRSEQLQTEEYGSMTALLEDELGKEDRLPPEVIALHLVHVSGENLEIKASTNANFVGVNPRERGVPWAQTPPNFDSPDTTAVSDPFTVELVDSPVFAILSPVPDSDHVLVMMVSAEARIASMPRPAEDGFTHVVDSDGMVVLSHHTDEILTQNMEAPGVNAPAVERGLDGDVGSMVMDRSSGDMLMGYAPVEGTDWVLMAHQPASTAFALQRSISRNLAILILVSVIGLAAIGTTIGRNTAGALRTLSDKAESIAEGELEDEIPTVNRSDELGQLYVAFADMQVRLRELLDDVESERENAERAHREAEALTDHLEEKAGEFSRVMSSAADGDLTARMDPESESDAMVQIATAYNDMMAEWAETLAHVRDFADAVAESSEEFTSSAREVKDASESVSTSIQEISDGAARQANDLQEVSGTMNDLSATIQEVASSAASVADTSSRAADVGETGRDAAEQAMDAIGDIESKTGATVDEVDSLHEEIDQIGEVVELITDIAEQTNLLALNASIEAARAGEAGDGFAVVADEVKALAEETQEATEEIDSAVSRIQAKTTDTVADIDEMNELVTEGGSTIERAIEALEEISEHVEATHDGITEIDEATDDQAAATQQVVSMVDEVASISEETTAQAESVVAASQQQAATTNEVANSATALSDRAAELQELLASFTLPDSAADSAPQPDVIDPSHTLEDD